jgi:hypothetical protein
MPCLLRVDQNLNTYTNLDLLNLSIKLEIPVNLYIKEINSNVTLSLNMSCLNVRLDKQKLFFKYQFLHCRIGHFCIKYLCVFYFKQGLLSFIPNLTL